MSSPGFLSKEKKLKFSKRQKEIERYQVERERSMLRLKVSLQKSSLPLCMDFGYQLKANYNRHSLPVRSIMWNPNSFGYVTYDDKNIHVWDPLNNRQVYHCNVFEQSKSHQITCISHASKFKIYIAASTDFKLLIFSQHLIFIDALPLKVRLINHLYFWEEQNKLFTAGIDGCYVLKFRIKTKYDLKQAALLDPEGKTMEFMITQKVKLKESPLWIKGLKVDLNQEIIFTWTQLELCFNDLTTGRIINKYKALSSYEDYITDLIISEYYKYFLTSTQFGSILVWKLSQKKKLIHAFNNHKRMVTSLCEHPDKTLFISASLDSTIRIWSLDKFTELYKFELPAGVTYIKLINPEKFACFYSENIRTGKIRHLAISFSTPSSPVLKLGKCFKSKIQQLTNEVKSFWCLCEDNALRVETPQGLSASTVYPPPTAKTIKCVEYSVPLGRFFLLLISGTLCIYNPSRETAVLEQIFYPQTLKDSEGKLVPQTISIIKLTNFTPPRIDHEILKERKKSNMRMDHRELRYTNPNCFMLFGMSKGTFIFVRAEEPMLVYSRFVIHREAVQQVEEMQITADRSVFASYCDEKILFVWGYNPKAQGTGSFVVFQSFNPLRRIISLKALDQRIVMIFPHGDMEIFEWDRKQKSLYLLETDKQHDHDKDITGIDVHQQERFFVTSGMDGRVKIWNFNRQLLREVNFPEPIKACCFKNEECDLLIGHVEKVSIVLASLYLPFQSENYTEELPHLLRQRVDELLFKNLANKFQEYKNQATRKHKYIHFELPGEKERRLQEKLMSRRNHIDGLDIYQDQKFRSMQKEYELEQKKKEAILTGQGDSVDPQSEKSETSSESDYTLTEQEKQSDLGFNIDQEYDRIMKKRADISRKPHSQPPDLKTRRKKPALPEVARGKKVAKRVKRDAQSTNPTIQKQEEEDQGKMIKEGMHKRQESYFHPSRVPTLPRIPKHSEDILPIINPKSSISYDQFPYNQYMMAKRKSHLTRREITDRKIVQNIEMFNDPADRIFHGDLSVSTAQNIYESTPAVSKIMESPRSYQQVNISKHSLFYGISPGQDDSGRYSPDYLGLKNNSSFIKGKKVQASNSKILLKAISSGENLSRVPDSGPLEKQQQEEE